jgi:hypothetical protein
MEVLPDIVGPDPVIVVCGAERGALGADTPGPDRPQRL